MDKQIKKILEDLYALDPELKAHERGLVLLVRDLVKSKPDTHFDESFASRLRGELLQTHTEPVASPYASFFVSRVFYGVLGSALTFLIAVPLTFIATQKATLPNSPVVFNPFNQVKDNTLNLTKQQISNKGINAFGKLALVPPEETAPKNTAQAVPSVSTLSEPSAASIAAPSARSVAPATIRNPQEDYTYTYKGGTVNLQNTDGRVFKRTKGIDSGKQLAGIIQASRFNLSDLTTFSNLSLKQVEMAENKPFGYTISVNFEDGAIAINPQRQFWGESGSNQSTTTDIEDSHLISIASEFTKAHSIDMTIYGAPVVTRTPEVSTVTYPLLIDGKQVYEVTSMPYGLVFTINLDQKKVMSITNLTSQIYESSLYKLETDFNIVLSAATSSLGQSRTERKGSTTREAELQTPSHVLMRSWFYDEKTQTNDELYIPALAFPVTYKDSPADGTLPTKIIVPLVKDFLAKQNAGVSFSQPLSFNN